MGDTDTPPGPSSQDRECSRVLPRGTSTLGAHLTPGLDPSLTTCPPPTYIEAMGTPAALLHLTITIHLVYPDSSIVSSDGLLEGQPSWMQHCGHRGVWTQNRWDAVRGREQPHTPDRGTEVSHNFFIGGYPMQALLQVAYLPPASPGIVPHVTPLVAPMMPFAHPAPAYVNRGGECRPPPNAKGGSYRPSLRQVARRRPPDPGGGTEIIHL